jgi:hypothetical protein
MNFSQRKNDDVMWCVICNESSLFAPRLKTLENIILKCCLSENTNSFLYNIETHSMYLNSIWLNLNSIPIQQLD